MVAAAFGYLILANTGLSMLLATVSGVLGVLITEAVTRRRLLRRPLAVAKLVTGQPTMRG